MNFTARLELALHCVPVPQVRVCVAMAALLLPVQARMLQIVLGLGRPAGCWYPTS